MKSLGATYAFDHRDPDVVEKILKVLKKGDLVFDCISFSRETQGVCGEILGKIGGGTLPVLRWPIGPFPENVEATLGMFNQPPEETDSCFSKSKSKC